MNSYSLGKQIVFKKEKINVEKEVILLAPFQNNKDQEVVLLKTSAWGLGKCFEPLSSYNSISDFTNAIESCIEIDRFENS